MIYEPIRDKFGNPLRPVVTGKPKHPYGRNAEIRWADVDWVRVDEVRRREAKAREEGKRIALEGMVEVEAGYAKHDYPVQFLTLLPKRGPPFAPVEGIRWLIIPLPEPETLTREEVMTKTETEKSERHL